MMRATMYNPASPGELLREFMGNSFCDGIGGTYRRCPGHDFTHSEWPHRRHHGFEHSSGRSFFSVAGFLLEGAIAAGFVGSFAAEAQED